MRRRRRALTDQAMEVPMAPVAVESQPIAVRRTRAAASFVLLAVAAGAVFVGLTALVRGPEFVDHVTVENRAPLEVGVAVADADDGALLGIATASPGRTARVTDVVDQGDRWIFVLTNAGEPVGRIELTRDELESRGWRVVLPGTLGPATLGNR
jgi:hypothetical protein